MTQAVEWVEPKKGFSYLTDTVQITAEQQRDKLEACGLEATVYGDCVDPSFFIGLAIKAGIHSGISTEGNINMVQSLAQHRPVRLGETLTVRGTITNVTAVPRGQTVDTDVWFESESGERTITASRRTLKPDPDKVGTRGAGARPAPVVNDPDKLRVRNEHQLTPAGVKAYSSEGNRIHYDMAAANASGFRAPMIGGGMGVHYLMAALWTYRSVFSCDLDLYFRRPVFWDDAFSMASDEQMTMACLWRYEDRVKKILTEARINQLS